MADSNMWGGCSIPSNIFYISIAFMCVLRIHMISFYIFGIYSPSWMLERGKFLNHNTKNKSRTSIHKTNISRTYFILFPKLLQSTRHMHVEKLLAKAYYYQTEKMNIFIIIFIFGLYDNFHRRRKIFERNWSLTTRWLLLIVIWYLNLNNSKKNVIFKSNRWWMENPWHTKPKLIILFTKQRMFESFPHPQNSSQLSFGCNFPLLQNWCFKIFRNVSENSVPFKRKPRHIAYNKSKYYKIGRKVILLLAKFNPTNRRE